MDKQGHGSDAIILPHSDVIPTNEAQKKAQELAKQQEQLLTMSTPLPDHISIYDRPAGLFYFNRDKKLIHFQLVLVPFFSQKIDSISFSYFTDNKSLYEDSFQSGWCLSFTMFSDNQLRQSFAQFAKQHPNEAIGTETIYLFHQTGNFAKTVRVHKDFPIKRQLRLDLKTFKDYASEMTRLDFTYTEQALKIMKEKLDSYRQLN